MAIVATLFGALRRFAGKLLTAALGWASTLLFGRVPQDKQILIVLMTFGSVVWVVLLIGVVLPEVGTLMLALVPIPDFVDENWIRLAMLAGALVVPLLIGLASRFIPPPDERPAGFDAVKGVLRGYPLAFVLALVLVFLALVASVRKVRALVKRWKDAHVAIVVKKGGYGRMVGDLERALDEAGLDVREETAPAVLAMPARVLGAVAGAGVGSLVPERLVQLVRPDLEVQLYPSDVALAGAEVAVNRARAAIASRLTATSAYMTTSLEAQQLEDRLLRIAERERLDADAGRQLAAIDDGLAHLELPYEEWEVLYRMRLQVERDLLTGRQPGAFAGEAPGSAGRRGGIAGANPPAPIEYVAAAGIVGLLLVDLYLAARERVAH